MRVDYQSIGAVLALLVIVAAFVLAIVGRMDPVLAGLFIALGLSRLL